MANAVKLVTGWKVTSIRSDGRFHGKPFVTESSARAYAEELQKSDYTDVQVVRSALKPAHA